MKASVCIVVEAAEETITGLERLGNFPSQLIGS